MGFGCLRRYNNCYASIKKIVKLTRKLLPKVTISLGGGVLTSIPKEVMT